MFNKLISTLRQDTYLLLTAFAGFAGSAWIGNLDTEASKFPIIWVGAIWVMLVFAVILVVVVALDVVMSLMGGS